MKSKPDPEDLPEDFSGEPVSQNVEKPLAELHPGEAAEVLQNLPASEQAEVLLNLEAPHAADILESLPDDKAAAAVMDMEPEDASVIVQEMQTDEQVDLLQDVSEEHAESILDQIDAKDAQAARKLLKYGEDSAGGLMQREYIPIYKERNAKEVILHLQTESEKYKDYPATYLHVVDATGRLNGVVSMRSLLLNKPDTTVKKLANTEFISVPASMPGQELVKVCGCSENQAAAVSIRELSLDRIRPGSFLRVLGKEASIGLLKGLALGIIIGLIAFAWKRNFLLGDIVGAALWINTIARAFRTAFCVRE